MSFKKFIHVLTAVILMSFMLLAIPASTVLAASEEITLDPEEGEIGDRIDIDGEDFEESTNEPDYDDSRVDIYFSNIEADEGDDIDDEVDDYERVKSTVSVDEDGEFSTYFRVPDELTDGDDDVDVKGGTYYVYVTAEDDENILAVAEFTVLSAEIELDDEEGKVGAEVEITGQDFSGSEEITVEFDGSDVDIESGDDETDSDGDFTCTIIIPEGTAGDHTISVTDETGAVAEATFTIEPELTVNPEDAAPNDSITVYGKGFGESVDVTISFDGDEVASDETDDDGSFQVTFDAPLESAGKHDIAAEDDDDNEAETEFTITSIIKVSKTAGNVGDTFTVSGAGFPPSGAITILFVGETTTTTADSNGEFSTTVTVPSGKSGAQTITVTGGSTTSTVTFTIDSVAPSAPQPLLPANGDKVEAQTLFDWRDVTDPSQPVSYTLQISLDANFSSTVIEKTGLERSDYTLTEGEKLDPADRDTKYYWRVRAVDAAGNESPWTGRGTFYITFSLGMLPGWLKYVLIGIGGAVLFLVGFLVGRTG